MTGSSSVAKPTKLVDEDGNGNHNVNDNCNVNDYIIVTLMFCRKIETYTVINDNAFWIAVTRKIHEIITELSAVN